MNPAGPLEPPSPGGLYAVVTTIQQPTPAMRRLQRALRRYQGHLLVAGDRKGPADYDLKGAELVTLAKQLDLPLLLPSLLPLNHYVRKNVGYLLAISRRASCIFETDDDNAPCSHWAPRAVQTRAIPVRKPAWYNVYAHFGDGLIWPRGFPLEEVGASRARKVQAQGASRGVYSPIQQGLADGNPDVDAIWRLLLSADIRFGTRESVALMRGVWCPFNSQCTWWWPEAYPLLYLPSYCTFRMTDIWRSFIAQRCVWELGGAVTFHAPEVVQDRNQHNLLRDFQDEVPGYLSNNRIHEVLEQLTLEAGVDSAGRNLLRCYEALVEAGIFPRKELRLVKAWLRDLSQASKAQVC